MAASNEKGKGKEWKGKERKGTFDPKGQTFRMKGKTNTTYQFHS